MVAEHCECANATEWYPLNHLYIFCYVCFNKIKGKAKECTVNGDWLQDSENSRKGIQSSFYNYVQCLNGNILIISEKVVLK